MLIQDDKRSTILEMKATGVEMTTTKRECKNCGAALRANQIDPHDNLCDQCYEVLEDARDGIIDKSYFSDDPVEYWEE